MPAKLYALGGARLDSAEYAADFASAEKFGPYRIGERAFYFREGLKQCCLPYADFDQVFCRAMLCSARHCGGVDNFDTFWLVFCREGEELCQAKTIDEKHAAAAYEALQGRLPGLKFGV